MLNGARKNYKIFEGNNEDQASKEELIDFINQGLITNIGDNRQKEFKTIKSIGNGNLDHVEKYKIDFVSKNFQGSIQNNNLDNGPINETWFKTPIKESNHLVANGYANAWLIEVDDFCKINKCVKNSDGSYEIELVLEFWPQRLFYLEFAMSMILVIYSIVYLILRSFGNGK